LTCSGIPQDPRKSVVVRGDCHAVRHAPAHAMIMTIDGQLPCERHTQPGPRGGCAPGAVAVPIQTAPPPARPPGPPAARSRSGVPLQPIAHVTVANSAEQGHRRRRGTSRSVPDCPISSTAPIIQWAPADATTRLRRPAITAASPPGLRLACGDRIGESIHEHAQVVPHG